MRKCNSTLFLFDAFACLNRLDSNLKRSGKDKTIQDLEWPRHTNIHIVDHMYDPMYWKQPITIFGIHIHRSIGIHPKYTASNDKAADAIIKFMRELIKTKYFIGITTGLEIINNNTYGLYFFEKILEMYTDGTTQLPLFIHSRNADDLIIEKLNQNPIFQTTNIIWHNMNLGDNSRFQTNFDYFINNANVHMSVNTLYNSNSKINHLLSHGNEMKHLLMETDSPHNNYRENKLPYTYPVMVARSITQVHIATSAKFEDQTATLADTAITHYNRMIKLLNIKNTKECSDLLFTSKYNEISKNHNINFYTTLNYVQTAQRSKPEQNTKQTSTKQHELQSLLKESTNLKQQLKRKHTDATQDEVMDAMINKAKAEIAIYKARLKNGDMEPQYPKPNTPMTSHDLDKAIERIESQQNYKENLDILELHKNMHQTNNQPKRVRFNDVIHNEPKSIRTKPNDPHTIETTDDEC
jgi:Tat protein secretion system quality control protein TatD with DNase activity